LKLESNKMALKDYYIGIDIGGTKCAVSAGTDQMEILHRMQFATHPEKGPFYAIDKIIVSIKELNKKYKMLQLKSIGISCGGPLNSKTGIIHSPPNLPGWDDIPIVSMIKEKMKTPTFIQNDANACALAEWKFGAGKGSKNMVFLTFGTGLGAGLILDGRLYTGTNGSAGEVGHIRLADDGPVGFNKAGSFEGFCSGSGITKLAQIKAEEKLNKGEKLSYCDSYDELQGITTFQLAKLANAGDEDALELFNISAMKLGAGLSIIIDILNPERIVIGSVYARNPQLFNTLVNEIIQKEALQGAANVCKIVPAELGDNVGNIASLSVAINGYSLISISK
jgi:glucokinase